MSKRILLLLLFLTPAVLFSANATVVGELFSSLT